MADFVNSTSEGCVKHCSFYCINMCSLHYHSDMWSILFLQKKLKYFVCCCCYCCFIPHSSNYFDKDKFVKPCSNLYIQSGILLYVILNSFEYGNTNWVQYLRNVDQGNDCRFHCMPHHIDHTQQKTPFCIQQACCQTASLAIKHHIP